MYLFKSLFLLLYFLPYVLRRITLRFTLHIRCIYVAHYSHALFDVIRRMSRPLRYILFTTFLPLFSYRFYDITILIYPCFYLHVILLQPPKNESSATVLNKKCCTTPRAMI